MHHKVFDLGVFTIVPNTFEMIFSQELVSAEPKVYEFSRTDHAANSNGTYFGCAALRRRA